MFVECGKTKQMRYRFIVNKDVADSEMDCSSSKHCYCYGKICLVGQSCSAGNVFVNGKPFCGVKSAWSTKIGQAICKELGFEKVKSMVKEGE